MLTLWKNSKRNKQRKATKPTTKTKCNQTKQKKKPLLYVFHKTQRLCHSSAALRLCWHLGQTRPRFLPSIFVMMVEKHPLSLSGLVKHRIDLVQPWGTEAGILVTVIPCSSVTQAACPTERAWKAP